MTLILSMLTFLWFTWTFTSQQEVGIGVSVSQEVVGGAPSSAPAGSAVLWHADPATLPHRRHVHFSPRNRANFHLLFQANLVFSSAQVYCFLRVGKVFTRSMC